MATPSSIQLITSRQNPLIKEIRAVRDDREATLLFLEGPRLLREALSASIRIHTLVLDATADTVPPASFTADSWQAFTAAAVRLAKRAVGVPHDVFEMLSDVESPQGVIAITDRPGPPHSSGRWEWSTLLENPSGSLVILDGLQDPGNASAIIRTAEAAGAQGIVTTPGTVRLYSPKALRGAMGSSLRMPILEHQSVTLIADAMKQKGYRLIGTDRAGKRYTEIDWRGSFGLVLGQEGQGMSDVWLPHLTEIAHIPIREPVDSLNVAAAAAILLFEASRQRLS